LLAVASHGFLWNSFTTSAVYGKCRTVPERIARVFDGMGETGYPVSEQDQEVSGAGPLVEAIKVPSGRHSAMMYPSAGGVRS
jgi:hypothetical protein